MTLSLPADVEPFLQDHHTFERIRGAAVYCLSLSRPTDLADEWDRTFEHRPDYWEELTDAKRVVYVGAAKDLLARLNDHHEGEKRKAALLEVCAIEGLRNVWWVDDPNRRFLEESQIATMMQNELGDTYVHSR